MTSFACPVATLHLWSGQFCSWPPFAAERHTGLLCMCMQACVYVYVGGRGFLFSQLHIFQSFSFSSAPQSPISRAQIFINDSFIVLESVLRIATSQIFAKQGLLQEKSLQMPAVCELLYKSPLNSCGGQGRKVCCCFFNSLPKHNQKIKIVWIKTFSQHISAPLSTAAAVRDKATYLLRLGCFTSYPVRTYCIWVAVDLNL